MNKIIILATSTISILVLQFSVFESMSAVARTDNESAEIKLAETSADDELEKEAPYNDSADTELFYEEGASADDKAEDSKINRDRAKDSDEPSSDETDEEKTNPPQGLNSEDIKVDNELETEAGTFEENSSEKPKIEDVRQPDVGEDNLPAEPPVNEAEVEF